MDTCRTGRRTLLSIALAVAFAARGKDFVLCRDGAAAAVIVMTTDKAPCVEVAARELQAHVAAMTGVHLPLLETRAGELSDQALDGRRPIYLGTSPATRELGLDGAALPGEGFILKVTGDWIAIVGRDGPAYGPNYRFATDSAGTLYGVYRFLEELGVRWFYPTDAGTVIPRRGGRLRVPELDLREAPFFSYRHTQYGNFAWGRRTGAGGDRDVWSTRHTCSTDLRKRFRKSHPQWFLPNADGKPGSQADLARPEVMEAIAGMARERFAQRSQAGQRYYLVIPLDGRTEPQDDARSRWVADAVLGVAARVGDGDGRIVYCAYSDYRQPPPDLADLPDNVVVLIALSRSELLDQSSRRKAYALVRSWQQRTPSAIYFCRYNGSRLGMVPAFIPHVIAEDLRSLQELSRSGETPIRGEMNFVSIPDDSPYSWWEHLNEYITAKLLWDPDRDVDLLLDDFCQRFFGPGAEAVRQFLSLCEERYLSSAERHVFTVDTIDSLDRHLRRAESATAGTAFAGRTAFFRAGFSSLEKMRKKQTVSAAPPNAADDSLLVRFRFDEGRGVETSDQVAGLKARLEQAAWFTGVRGAGVLLSGPGSVIRLSAPVSLKETDYTIEAWVKPEQPGPGRQFIVGPGAWERQLLMIRFGLPAQKGCAGRVVLKHRQWHGGRNIELASAPVEFVRGVWYHLVGTFSQRHGMSIYVNGELVGLDMALTGASDMSFRMIGASGNGATEDPNDVVDEFLGVIDEVNVYGRELSFTEVKQRFARQSPKGSGLAE